MAAITTAVLRQQLATGDVGPLYVLEGEDEAEKSAVAAEFGELVDEGLRPFNLDRFYGGETRVDALIEAANTLPMMVPRRVVVVLEAEKLLVPKRETKAAEADQARLEAFIQSPPGHAIIVFVGGSLDQRRRVVKALLKQAQVVNCGTIADAAGADLWVKTRAARDKVPLDPGAVRALVERSGLDIVRLRAGLERVALYAMGQPTITAEDVRAAVPATAPPSANFGIANAIQNSDTREALRQLTLVLDEGAEPFFVLGQLRFAAEKLPSPRLRTAIEAVLRTDLALKGSGGDQRVLLERLVVELCGGTGGRAAVGPPRQAWRPRQGRSR